MVFNVVGVEFGRRCGICVVVFNNGIMFERKELVR